MADIKLEHISKSYPPDVKAVDDVSLHINDGEKFMNLLGPSGCGKSTTLRMIAGLGSITTGDLYLGDTGPTMSTRAIVTSRSSSRTTRSIRT